MLNNKGFLLIESLFFMQIIIVISVVLCSSLILFAKERKTMMEREYNDEISLMKKAYE